MEQFQEETPVLDIPVDYPRPQERSIEGSVLTALLDENICEGIHCIAQKTGTTDYMVFLATLMVTLSKYSRQEDIVIGCPVSGKMHKDAAEMFENTLPMRGKPAKEKMFTEFLLEVKETCLKAYENQEYHFEMLVEDIDIHRDMSRNPLFDVMLTLQNNEDADIGFDGTRAEDNGAGSCVAKLDLAFIVVETNDTFGVMLEYCTRLFKRETAEYILMHYVETLRQVCGDMNFRK